MESMKSWIQRKMKLLRLIRGRRRLQRWNKEIRKNLKRLQPIETDSLIQESPDKQKIPVEVMPNLWLKASPMMHSWMAQTLEEAALLTEQLEKQCQSLITQLRK